MGNTKAYSGIGWVRFKQIFFAQIRVAIFIKYLLQKIERRNCFVQKHKHKPLCPALDN